ncbi:hypothetical protein AB0N20_20660 [Streptomyces griseoincarnatus]
MLARARAHRPLLAAARLTILLTTAVLAALAAYSTTIGDASLRHALANPRDAAGTTLLVKAESLPEGGRTAADAAVRRAAEQAYDGLPVTLRTLARSGPYGLPPSLRPADRRAGSEEPDLTHFAALDRTQVRLTEGRMPSARPAGPEIEVALPVVAARELGLRPGARITLDNRLRGPAARVLVTGLYRPADTSAPYWQLDELAGRGIVTVHFTTYGPLLADPAVPTGGRVSAGPVGWLASADFSGTTAGRIDALRTAMKEGVAALPHAPALHGSATAAGDLPATLDRVERARAGTQVRVLSNGTEGPGRGAAYAAVPGVRSASPALRSTVSLSGGRQATVLALDTAGTAGTLLMRPGLADVPVRTVLSGLAPKGATAGVRVPAGTARLALTASLRGADAAAVTATVEDAHGTPYPLTLGELPPDGRPHDLGVVPREAVAGAGRGPGAAGHAGSARAVLDAGSRPLGRPRP